jgi:exosortase/archaeosortase family protein
VKLLRRERGWEKGRPSQPETSLLTRVLRRAFIGRFLGLWFVGLVALSILPTIEHATVALTRENVILLFNVGGIETDLQDSVIHVGRVSFRIIPKCTPLLPILAVVCGVAASPYSLSAKIIGVVGGSVVLWVFNLLRIAVTILVIYEVPRYATFIHVYVLQSLTLVVMAACYWGWLQLMDLKESLE